MNALQLCIQPLEQIVVDGFHFLKTISFISITRSYTHSKYIFCAIVGETNELNMPKENRGIFSNSHFQLLTLEDFFVKIEIAVTYKRQQNRKMGGKTINSQP